MSNLLDDIQSALAPHMAQLSDSTGTEPGTAQAAVSAALPMMVAALSRNASNNDGAAALAVALERDHDGTVLDDVAGFLGSGATSDGQKIVGHMFGKRADNLQSALGGLSGMDQGQIQSLLAMLAPIVLGYLGREKRSAGLDAGTLAGLLGAERERTVRAQPEAAGLLDRLLDQDDDGSIVDDVTNLGAGLLGSLFDSKQ